MHLHDILRVCLLALSIRYPEHSVDIDTHACGLSGVPEQGWTATQVLELLAHKAPGLLVEPVSLCITSNCCAIFLSKLGKDRPAILIHCRGKIPAGQSDILLLCKRMFNFLPTFSTSVHQYVL